MVLARVVALERKGKGKDKSRRMSVVRILHGDGVKLLLVSEVSEVSEGVLCCLVLVLVSLRWSSKGSPCYGST